MKTAHIAIAIVFLVVSSGVFDKGSAQVFTDLGSPYPWAENLWSLTPAYDPGTEGDTIYGGVSKGGLPQGVGRLFRYDPPDYGSFTDIGFVLDEVVIYSLTTSSKNHIYGGTGEDAWLFRYIPGTVIEPLGQMHGDTYICDLTRGFQPWDDRIYGGTAYNAHFFWYEPGEGLVDFGPPVPGETGIWAVTSGASIQSWIVGGTAPLGYLFQFEALPDTYPPPYVMGPVGGIIRTMTSGLASGPTAGKVYGGTLSFGYGGEDTMGTGWTEESGAAFFVLDPYEREWEIVGYLDEGSINAMTTGMDDMIYFGKSTGNENAQLCQYDPTKDWGPGNPHCWPLPDPPFAATRIRSLCTDTYTGWIYGGTGRGGEAQLFRFVPPVGDGRGSQTAATGRTDRPSLSIVGQNYPNPFCSQTTITYHMTWGRGSGIENPRPHVTLSIYDVTGRLVKVLVDETQGAGDHSVPWDGTDSWGKDVPSGIYFCELRAGGLTETRKATLLR